MKQRMFIGLLRMAAVACLCLLLVTASARVVMAQPLAQVVAALESAVSTLRAQVAALEGETEAHRTTIKALQNESAAQQGVINALEREAAAQQAAITTLQSMLAGPTSNVPLP